MAGFLEQVGNVARDAAQGLGCAVESYQGLIRRLTPFDSPFPGPPSLWPLLCPDRPPPPEVFPDETPPFTGGQCEDASYTVEGDVEYVPFDPNEPTASGGRFIRRFLEGPIFAIEDDGSPNASRGQIRHGDGSGGEQITTIPGSSIDGTWVASNITVVRDDGGPDDCGDPPPLPPPPPGPLPDLPPEDRPVTDPDGGPDIDFTFKPTVGPIFIDIDNNLKIPVNVNIDGPNIFAPINIPVNINLPDFEPEFNFNGGGGGTEPPISPCCEPPAIPGEEEEGEEDEPIATDPPPEGAKMFGVRVRSTVNAARTTASAISTGADVPTLWVPRIGSVYFEMEITQSEGPPVTTYSQDYDVKLDNQIIVGPDYGVIRRAFVRPGRGVSATATPLFVAARN